MNRRCYIMITPLILIISLILIPFFLNQEKEENIIIINIDSLRADYLPNYENINISTPTIENLAKESYIYKNAYSQGPWTKSSVASLFTGLYPQQHLADLDNFEKYLNFKSYLEEDLITLAEALHSKYDTIGIIAGNPQINNGSQYNQGFDKYINLNFSKNVDQEAINIFKKIINENKNSKFIYIHLMGVHMPYFTRTNSSKECYININNQTVSLNNKLDNNVNQFLGGLLAKNIFPIKETIQCLKNNYIENIIEIDKKIAQIIKILKDQNQYENSIIILTADHGEELFERGNWGHGQTLFNEQIKIPLIMKLPYQTKGEIILKPVQQIDIFPTLLSLTNISIGLPYHLPSISLFDIKENRLVVSHLLKSHAIINNSFKYINHGYLKQQLYDLKNNSNESKNIINEKQNIADNILENYHINEINITLTNKTIIFDEERIKELEALGYSN